MPGAACCVYCLKVASRDLPLDLDHINECNAFHCLAERNRDTYDSSTEIWEVISNAANCGSNVGRACKSCNQAKKGPVIRLMNSSKKGSGLNEGEMIYRLDHSSVIDRLLQTNQIEHTEESRDRLTLVFLTALDGTVNHLRAQGQPHLASDLQLLQSGILVSTVEERWGHIRLWLIKNGFTFEVSGCVL